MFFAEPVTPRRQAVGLATPDPLKARRASGSQGRQSCKDDKRSMPAFKNPGFQERQNAAASAKIAALQAYRAKPPIDEAVTAERAARRLAKEAAAAGKRAALAEARAAAAEARREHERQAAAAAEAEKQAGAQAAAEAKASATARRVEERKLWTEDDRKAARDARYAARKARQGRR